MTAPTQTVEENLHRYLDEGWDGTGWRPSELLTIGAAIYATGSAVDGVDMAAEFRRTMIKSARDLYRAGYYADPFTDAPRQRVVA